MAVEPNETISMLSSLREPTFGIPTDVTFHIMGRVAANQAEVLLGGVVGHKVILGMASPVFKEELFGLLKEKDNVILVRETTVKAFNIMLDYIYNKNIDWSEVDLLELYDVVNLAEKYLMPGLLEKIRVLVQNFPLTMSSLLDVAHTAFQFTQFPSISSELIQTCAKFLKVSLKTDSELLNFATNLSGSGQELTGLHLLKVLRTISTRCPNCRAEECEDGKEISNPDGFYHNCMVTWGSGSFSAVQCVDYVELNKKVVRMKSNSRIYIIEAVTNKPNLRYKCT